jgi:DNA-binding NtrC family response regulator
MDTNTLATNTATETTHSDASELAIDHGWPTLEEIRRRYISRALERTRGNKTRAADMLGIDRRTLNRILARERRRQSNPTGARQPEQAASLRA